MSTLHDNSTPGDAAAVAGHHAPWIAAACLGAVALGAVGLQVRRTNAPIVSASTHGQQVLRTAAPIRKRTRIERKRPTLWHQIGLASWYGKEFQGKQTANGEIFNMNDLTCAHRFLPLGTWVKVTNLHTRKWIVVRVNDRGPVPETRIADLSSQAARLLGMHARGITRVRLDVIDSRQAVEVARLDRLRLARLAAEANLPDASIDTVPLPSPVQ